MPVRTGFRDLATRVFQGAARGTLVKANDKTLWQEGEVRSRHGERYKNVEIISPDGFTGVPMPAKSEQDREAAEFLLIFPHGSRSHPVALPIGDRRHRFNNLKEGEKVFHKTGDDNSESQVYHADDYLLIHRKDKKIHIQLGSNTHMLLDANKVKIQQGTASVTCKGGKVFLGKEDVTHKVMTEDGPSEIVFASIGETDTAMQADGHAKRTKASQSEGGGGGS